MDNQLEQNDNIVVSVVCICHNHEKYIAKTIEGFLKQKTSFQFEILINDDASIDSSQKIIRKYADMDSRIIPFLQEENLFSRGVKITEGILLPMAKGKYIAFCEGDDYWIDPNKLQIQFDYMEKHKECYLCTHANNIIKENGEFVKSNHRADKDCDLNLDECIKEIPGQTASYFVRRSLYSLFSRAKQFCPVGDYSLCIEAAMNGPVHYINRIMSCYRTLSDGSLSVRMLTDIDYVLNYFKKYIVYFNELEILFPNNTQVKKKIEECKFKLLYSSKKYIPAFKTEYYRCLSFKSKISFYLQARCPFIYSMLHKIYLKFNKSI